MKNLLLLLFVSFFSNFSFAQGIEGRVFDVKTNQPISEVHVFINNKQIGTLTNPRGKFKLKASKKLSKNDTIYFSHIGYETEAFPFSENKRKYLVYLDASINKLDEISLQGNKKLSLKLNYNKLTPMKKGRYSFGSVLIDGNIYVIGGDISYKIEAFRESIDNNPLINNPNSTFEDLMRYYEKDYSKQIHIGGLLKYNIASDTWEIDSLQLKKRAKHTVNLHNNKIYVMGGTRVSRNGFEFLEDEIEVLDINNKSIQLDKTNPHQAVDFASFTYGDKIILMGGSIKKKKNGEKVYSNKVHFYDLKSGFWYELAAMPSAKETEGVLIGDKIYTFGGFNGKPLKDIETFDLVSGKWQKEGELFTEFSKPGIAKGDNTVYIFEDGKLLTYEVNTKELKEYRIDLFLNASELLYDDSYLYILGGFRKEEYSLFPSRGLFRVDLNQLKNTKVVKSKIL